MRLTSSVVAQASIYLLDIASSAMQDLASTTQTLVLMAVDDGSSMTLIRTWRPHDVPSIWLEPGNRVPMEGSPTSVCFLAALAACRIESMNAPPR